jgi:hypothetical protein
MKRICAVALVALFVACDTVPRHKLTLTFNDAGDRVTIESSTTLPPLKEAKDRARVEHLRDEFLAGRDEWALRFVNAAPERDRVVFDRTGGELTEVTRSATIDADDLQKFFYDLPITAKVTRDNGVVELAIYPGTSNRATREEREAFEKQMNDGAAAARRYINAMRVLYEYLDEHPQRAHDTFDALFRDEKDPRPVVATEREMALVTAVREAMDHLLDLNWSDAAREADVVANPFPAEIFVRTPGEPTLVEGFARDEHGVYYIRPKMLFEAVASLEGRWISPDPIALALRSPELKEEEMIDLLAKSRRHAEPVVGFQEVLAGITAQLKPAERYRVRFLVKSSAGNAGVSPAGQQASAPAGGGTPPCRPPRTAALRQIVRTMTTAASPSG